MDTEQPPPYFVEAVSGHHQRDRLPPIPARPISEVYPNIGYQPPKIGWCEDSQKNKPQSNSLAAAVIIFTSGGMSLAYSLGFSSLYSDFRGSSQPYEQHTQICWFLAVIIGALLGTALIDILQKRILNLWASGLVIINGILFLSAPESSLSIISARYCDGIAVGLTIIAAIVAGSEQAVKRFRGLVLIAESLGIMTGIMLKTIFTSIWQNEWDVSSNRMHGIVALVLGILALACTSYLTLESPIFFLRQNRENNEMTEEEAIQSLKRLQTYGDVAERTYYLYENKNLLKEDTSRGHLKNMRSSYVPMIKLCFYRAFVAMSFSLPLNWGLAYVSNLMVEETNFWWSAYIYGIMRLTGVVVSIFTIDTVGRRGITAIAMIVGGGLLIGVGSVSANSYNLEDQGKLVTIVTLLILYQLFSGMAAPASTVYLGEAFSISVKPLFILIAVTFENVIQIIITCAFGYSVKAMSTYSITLGALQIVFAIAFVFLMPETKQTTLREALKLFKPRVNIDYKIKLIRLNKT